jgi:hypothetical protein
MKRDEAPALDVRLMNAAAIALLDARSQEFTLCVQQHHGWHHARHADGLDFVRFDAGLRQ